MERMREGNGGRKSACRNKALRLGRFSKYQYNNQQKIREILEKSVKCDLLQMSSYVSHTNKL